MQKYIKECFLAPLDYETLSTHCERIASMGAGVELSYIGQSLLSKKIPMLSFGRGEKSVVYIAGHHGAEWLCGCVLLAFLYELCERSREGRRAFSASIPYIEQSRRICVIPVLNVDGCEIEIHGPDPLCPMYERLCRANGTEDFSLWQANARGVDLNHNYNALFSEYKRLEREAGIRSAAPTRYSGEYPESEPECAALCNLLRFFSPALVLSFHSQGEVIYGGVSDSLPCGKQIGMRLCEMSGYSMSSPEGPAAYGGLADWYSREMGLPSFTIECGLGKNPLPLSSGEGIYRRLRELLFTSPMLV